MKPDHALELLLNLDGAIFPMDNGYWVKFEVKLVERNEHIPHGIRYSLSLHDKNNHRVFGIDNAHSFKPDRQKYGARKTAWDHRHIRENVLPFEFDKPENSLEYFWQEVDRIIENQRS